MIYWPFDPTVDVGLVILAVAYAWLGRRTGITTRGRLYFTLGLLTIWAALETPLDPLGDYYLQSAHMVQHMLLVAYAPPLLLLGLSPPMVAMLRRIPGLSSAVEPVPAMTLYSVVVIGWHVPYLYDLAIENGVVHVLEHLCFIAAGFIFWWPAIDVTSNQSARPLGYWLRIIYVFVGTIPMLAVALPLQFSRTLFYRPYAQAPMLVSGIDHVIDQTIAGVLMFSMDMVVMAFDALVVFLRLVRLEQEAADSQLGHTSSSGGSSQHEA